MVFHIIGRPYNSVNIDGKLLDCSSIFDYAQLLRWFSLTDLSRELGAQLNVCKFNLHDEHVSC